MTEKEDWKALQPPLIFGNEQQIEARRFLEHLIDAQDELLKSRNLEAVMQHFRSDVNEALVHRINHSRLGKKFPELKLLQNIDLDCEECSGTGECPCCEGSGKKHGLQSAA
jgi:hypothetical protein